MDVNHVLEATLSPDATIRTNAEQQLSTAAEADFAGYLSILSRELGNEQAQASTRQAAGLALKNALSSRDANHLREIQQRWVQQIDPQVKKQVKDTALQTLSTGGLAGTSAAQFIASVAAIELPRNEWPELMPALVNNVGTGTDILKQTSLTTIGFVCESEDGELREALIMHSNAILTAVVQGARKEEPNNDVRNAALSALGDATEFVRTNFENEGERNYIMQVVCESTQSDDERVQAGAFGCLNRIMSIYYDKMRFYMEKALFGLTIMGMKSDEEDVAKLAIEFWCTVCEEEISIEDDNQQATQEGSTELRPFFQFARIAGREVLPVLLQLLTKVDETDAEDDYNVAKAAYQCLQLYAQCIGGEVVPPVLSFVEANLRNEDWHNRDAAVASFGAIMDGPDTKTLEPLVKQALPVLISMMDDQSIQVKDSAAYALSRICDFCSDSIDPETHLQPLMSALFNGLMSSPKMAASCCLALMNLTERFVGEDGAAQNALTRHFQESVSSLLAVTEKEGADNQLRTAAYEVLGGFVTNAANDSLQIVASLSDIVLRRLEATIPMQKQVVSVDDKITLEELQTSLASVLLCIIQRLEQNIAPQADRIMQVCLEVLNVTGNTSVPDTIFAVVGALTNSLEADFLKYMESFVPYLYNALGNQEAYGLCAMAIGLVSDIVRALGEKAQPYCDTFMNYLLNNLRSEKLNSQLKPSILQTFGDIANAIGLHFETYLMVVAQVLQQAAGVTATSDHSFDTLDYILSLREGIVDAWGGILLAFKESPKAALLQTFVEPIFMLLQTIAQDQNRSEGLLRASMGVIGDLADAFPGGEISQYYRAEWVSKLIKETRTNRDFSARTIQTAKWAREQVKRQLAAQHQGYVVDENTLAHQLSSARSSSEITLCARELIAPCSSEDENYVDIPRRNSNRSKATPVSRLAAQSIVFFPNRPIPSLASVSASDHSDNPQHRHKRCESSDSQTIPAQPPLNVQTALNHSSLLASGLRSQSMDTGSLVISPMTPIGLTTESGDATSRVGLYPRPRLSDVMTLYRQAGGVAGATDYVVDSVDKESTLFGDAPVAEWEQMEKEADNSEYPPLFMY